METKSVAPVQADLDPVYSSQEEANAELIKRLKKPEQQQIEQSPEQRAKHIWEDPEDDSSIEGTRKAQIELQKRNAKKAGEPVEEREKIKQDEADRRQELKDQKAKEEQEAIDRRNRGEPEPPLAQDQKPLELRKAEEKEEERLKGLKDQKPSTDKDAKEDKAKASTADKKI